MPLSTAVNLSSGGKPFGAPLAVGSQHPMLSHYIPAVLRCHLEGTTLAHSIVRLWAVGLTYSLCPGPYSHTAERMLRICFCKVVL